MISPKRLPSSVYNVYIFRCVSSENECSKLRDKTVEARRKLDDSQGALQELGRENQTLQVG